MTGALPAVETVAAAETPAFAGLHVPRRVALAAVCLAAAFFALALAPRFMVVDTVLTSDEGYWMQRTLGFGAALRRGDLRGTYRSGHPGVTVTWVGLLGIGPERLFALTRVRNLDLPLLERAPGYLDALAAARRAIIVITAILMTVIVGLAWRLLGPGPALVGGFLLLLDPYLVGSAQLLHVDTLLAPLMTVSALAGLVYWTASGHRGYLVLSAVAGGLAALTKAPAVALPIYFGLIGLVAARPWRHGWRRLRPLVAWGVVAGLVYLVLWPALWLEPIRRLGQVIAFALSIGGNPHLWPNFFLGRAIVDDPGPLYYPVALGYRIGPVVCLGLAALAVGLRRRRLRSAPVLWSLAYVVLFVALMTAGPKKFDRYMLPAIMVLDVLAGVGLWMVTREIRSLRLGNAALAIAMVAQLLLLWQAYPYPLAAYNPLLGGTDGARQAIMVGWGEGLEQTADYLNGRPDAEQLVVATHYHHVLRPLFRGTTVRAGDYLNTRASGGTTLPDYFVVYVNMAQRGLLPTSVQRVMVDTPPEFTTRVHGVEYAWVYRLPRSVDQSLPPDEPRLLDEPED